MPTWTNWILDFLVAAHLPTTDENVTFLTNWTNHEQSNCNNNPVDVSRKVGNSTNCHKLTSTRTAQKYTSHAQAASAFNLQLQTNAFSHLYAALKGGTPLDKGLQADIITDLRKWGSVKFADWLENIYFPPPPPGPKTTGIHKGWADLTRSLGKHRLGAKTSATHRLDAATLRAIRRGRKVRIR